jgi:hypothetical protein
MSDLYKELLNGVLNGTRKSLQSFESIYLRDKIEGAIRKFLLFFNLDHIRFRYSRRTFSFMIDNGFIEYWNVLLPFMNLYEKREFSEMEQSRQGRIFRKLCNGISGFEFILKHTLRRREYLRVIIENEIRERFEIDGYTKPLVYLECTKPFMIWYLFHFNLYDFCRCFQNLHIDEIFSAIKSIRIWPVNELNLFRKGPDFYHKMLYDLKALKDGLYITLQKIARRQCMRELLYGPPKSIYDEGVKFYKAHLYYGR